MKQNLFFILLSMANGPNYGSAVQDDVRRLSAGRVRLWPATLYGSLEELVSKGWLSHRPDHEPPEGSAGRERFYELTSEGRTALEDETSRMEGLARAARHRLAGAGDA